LFGVDGENAVASEDGGLTAMIMLMMHLKGGYKTLFTRARFQTPQHTADDHL